MEITKDDIKATYKSSDTEEWLDVHFTRPIGYLWTLFFNHFNVHPNVVTVLSIFLGMAAGLMFYYPDLLHNVIGVLLLMWANFYDSCDGQLARLTGKKTRWGRMLDGFAGDLWFLVIYIAICLRLYDQPIPFTSIRWGIWIFMLAIVCGTLMHSRQCQLADYYRNIHMYFLKGASSELDTSAKQTEIRNATPKKGNFWWRAFLWGYARYTRSQERMTPKFQALFHYINEKQEGKVSDQFCADFRKESLPLMKYANILTFNCRALTLYIGCLLNIPWLYLLVELTLFTLLAEYMRHRHETMCAHFLELLQQGQYKA